MYLCSLSFMKKMKNLILILYLLSSLAVHSQLDVLVVYRTTWGTDGTFPCVQNYAGTNGNFTLCPMLPVPPTSNVAAPPCMVSLTSYDIVMINATYSDVDTAFITQLLNYIYTGGSVFFLNNCGAPPTTAEVQNINDLLLGIGQSGISLTFSGTTFTQTPVIGGVGASNYACPLNPMYYSTGGFLTGASLSNATTVSLIGGTPLAFWPTGYGGILGIGTEFYSSGNWDGSCLIGSGEFIWNMMTGNNCNLMANFSLSSDSICIGDCINIIDLSVSYAPATIINWDYQISGGTPTSSAVQNPTNICFNTVGNFDIILTVQDDQGNTDDTTMQIVVSSCAPVFEISLVGDTICNGQCTNLIASVTAAISPVNFVWDNGITSTIDSVNVCPSTTTTYTVTVTDATGFIDTAVATITVLPLPIVNIGNDTIICGGQILVLDAENVGATYLWQNATSNQTFSVDSDGEYSVTVTNSSGCQASDTINIIIEEAFAEFSISDTIGCAPLNVCFFDQSINTTSIVSWLWDFGDGNVSSLQNPIHNYGASGTYNVSLQITSINNCISYTSKLVSIVVYLQPIARFTFSPLNPNIGNEIIFEDLSIDATSWLWNFGDGNFSSIQNPTHVYNSINNFNVSLRVSNNLCSDSTFRRIIIEEELIFYVPNCFTPNGDMHNNTFLPVFTSGYDPYNYHFMIFNRWGKMLFESYNVLSGWDGTYGHEGIVEDGVYIWKIQVDDINSNKKHEYTGHVTLLK